MFKKELWAIIHNRFKDGNDLRWYGGMTAAEWWLQGAFGDPYATDENMISEAPVRASFAGFLQRLHRAYNGDLNYFADPDEWSWYQEWVRPFQDPLGEDYRMGELNGQRPYTDVPEDYFGNLRYYFENEAPGDWFRNAFNNKDYGWGWEPNGKDLFPFQDAINKQVI